MKKAWVVALAAFAFGCVGQEVAYHPAPQILPANIRKIAIRPKKPGMTVRARTGYFAPLPAN